MSRPVKKRHGIIYDDNIYSCRNSEGEHETFRYCVMVEPYKGAESFLNFEIRTPAEQLLFAPRTVPVPACGRRFLTDQYADIFVLKPFFVKWLDENTSGWCIQRNLHDMVEMPTLFFHKRKDILKFLDLLDKHLSGLHLHKPEKKDRK